MDWVSDWEGEERRESLGSENRMERVDERTNRKKVFAFKNF